jgi:hypothetical protein
LAHVAAELVDCLVVLVAVRRLHGMGAVDSRSLRFDSYVDMQHFVLRTTFVSFMRFWVMCGENSRNVFLLVMLLWVPISATLALHEVIPTDVVACVHVPRA